MTATVQIENSHLRVRLEIRRRLCRQLGEPLAVLDCCAAGGAVWSALRAELEVAAYLPIDLKPQLPATLRADSRAILSHMDISRFNVIDIDTFSEPWDHWLRLAPRIARRLAVFLTHGHVAAGGGNLSHLAREAMGLPARWQIPLGPALIRFSGSYCLSRGCEKLTIHHCMRWTSARVDYWGLIVAPKTGKGKA